MGFEAINLAEDAERQAFYARRMARHVATASANGFTVEQVTQGQLYPAAEVAQYLDEAANDAEPDISEGQALKTVQESVDVSDVLRLGEGATVVYKPVLLLEIRTHDCSALERAIHAILDYRGAKIAGAGSEWSSRDEVVAIYRSVAQRETTGPQTADPNPA